jgi:TetR/AcrR family transcriptional regulator, cholesterol catabolism regulator
VARAGRDGLVNRPPRDPRFATASRHFGRASRGEEVYAAALRLFNQKGYHATSMQDIAEAVGLYKGSLYHYIGGKEDLLVRVFERAMGSLLEEVELVVADVSVSPRDQLRLVVEAHVRAVADNLDALTVYLHEFRALAGESLGNVRAQRERYRQLVETIVSRGVLLGEFAAADVAVTTLGILGMCNWLAQWYRPGGRLSAREIGSQFADLMLEGLLSPSSSRIPAHPESRQKQ